MRLRLDATLCQGYGLCKEKAPDLIELDEWGYAAVTDTEVSDTAAARAAVAECPAAALRLERS